MKPVTDPALLAQLNAKPVTDPDLLAQLNGSAPAKPESGILKNIGMGALKGVADIGSTLLRPVDAALNAAGLTETTNAQRRQSINDLMQQNADPESVAFMAGQLGSNVAGTAGVGGLLAGGVRGAAALSPMLAQYAPKLATALETGGLKLAGAPAVTKAEMAANAATRIGAGAAVGGVSAGLVNPNDAGAGAAIGGALPPAVKAAGVAGRGIRNASGALVKNTLGGFTGVGPNAISQAALAGQNADDSFLRNMRGEVKMTDVLTDAKDALNAMRVARGNEYRQGMAGVSTDKTVLDLNPIISAVQNVQNMGSFKGQVIRKNAAGTVDEIAEQVNQWAALDPAEFHTPEGLDALKQAIGDIRDSTQFGTPARKAADSVYQAVKQQISKQAPQYDAVMKDYSEASDLIGEIEKAIVGKDKTSADTAMRKLQSLMRNNVNTNYGNRLDLARELEQQGGANLMPALAGQAMSSFTPRGLQGAVASAAGIGSLLEPSLLATLPLQSPRLVGEAAYAFGRASGSASQGMNQATNALAAKLGMSPNALREAMGSPVVRNALYVNQASP